MLRAILVIGAVVGVLAFLATPASRSSAAASDPLVARGKYLVVVGACNDCHTAGWRASDGHIPVRSWMTGNTIGLRESWGTEYPANVRARFREIDEKGWLFEVRTRGGRMQWHDLRSLSLDDQRAIYRFVRSLGPSSAAVPADVPPGVEPRTPYIDLRVRTPASSP